MTRLLRHALQHGYAVGYFEAWNLESLLAVKDAAETARSPVIVGFNGGFLGNPQRRVRENIFVYGRLGRTVAEQAAVPMSLILNESPDTSFLLEALRAGFNTIMHDHEGCSIAEATRINSSLVTAAHATAAEVEAEIGELPMAEIGGGASRGSMTNPEEAARFVDETGVDALAVAIGNVHVLEGRKSRLDFNLLDELRRKIRVPLVLHGGTGIDPDDLRKAIKGGICKVNVGTTLRRTFINSLKGYFLTHEVDRLDPGAVTSVGGHQDMLAAARADVAAEVERLMRLFGSDNKAAAISEDG
jgi:fructose-bisphosphate aldolase class II